MAKEYVSKTNWISSETVKPIDMNRIEKGIDEGWFSENDKSKLAGIEANAQKNLLPMNNLTSSSLTYPLSANMGRVLSEKITTDIDALVPKTAIFGINESDSSGVSSSVTETLNRVNYLFRLGTIEGGKYANALILSAHWVAYKSATDVDLKRGINFTSDVECEIIQASTPTIRLSKLTPHNVYSTKFQGSIVITYIPDGRQNNFMLFRQPASEFCYENFTLNRPTYFVDEDLRIMYSPVYDSQEEEYLSNGEISLNMKVADYTVQGTADSLKTTLTNKLVAKLKKYNFPFERYVLWIVISKVNGGGLVYERIPLGTYA